MDEGWNKCLLCPERARPKSKWSTVLDSQVAKSLSNVLDSNEVFEMFLHANYCGPCQEFVLNIDFLMRSMSDIQIKILKCQAKLSQCLMDNTDIWSSDTMDSSPQFDAAELQGESADPEVPSIKVDIHAAVVLEHDSSASAPTASDICEIDTSSPYSARSAIPDDHVPVPPRSESIHAAVTHGQIHVEKQIRDEVSESFSSSKYPIPVRRSTRSSAAKVSISYAEDLQDEDDQDESDADFVADIADSDSESADEDENTVDNHKTRSSNSVAVIEDDGAPNQNAVQGKDITESVSLTQATATCRSRSKRKRATLIVTQDQKDEDDAAGKTKKAKKPVPHKSRRRNQKTGPQREKSAKHTVENRIVVPRPDGRVECFHENCTKNYLKIRELRRHIFRWHTERTPEEESKLFPARFRCREPGCTFKCASDRFFKAHQLGVHQNDPRPFKCKLCDKNYTSADTLSQHIMLIHKAKKLVCEICGKHYRSKTRLHAHFRVKHRDVEGYKCSICSKMYILQEDWEEHEEKHSRTDLFKEQGHLTCVLTYCTKPVFETQELLREHVALVHDTQRMKICDECGLSFLTNFQLKTHKATHTDELPYNCSECDKRFRAKHNLKSHFETMHGADKGQVYPCTRCEQTFHCRAYLNKHTAWHRHGDNANKPLAKQKRDSDD